MRREKGRAGFLPFSPRRTNLMMVAKRRLFARPPHNQVRRGKHKTKREGEMGRGCQAIWATVDRPPMY